MGGAAGERVILLTGKGLNATVPRRSGPRWTGMQAARSVPWARSLRDEYFSTPGS